jgi:hypothetical protein
LRLLQRAHRSLSPVSGQWQRLLRMGELVSSSARVTAVVSQHVV